MRVMVTVDERSATRRLHDRIAFGRPPGEPGGNFASSVDRLLDPVATTRDPGAAATPPPSLGMPPERPKKGADPSARQQAKARLRAQQNTLTL